MSPKKLYLAGTGFFNVLIDDVNFGAIVENAVYLKLKKIGKVKILSLLRNRRGMKSREEKREDVHLLPL